jgi:hypothetical protein
MSDFDADNSVQMRDFGHDRPYLYRGTQVPEGTQGEIANSVMRA